MSQDVHDWMERIRNRPRPDPIPPRLDLPYAFTEIITVKCTQDASISDETSPCAQLWARTRDIYQGHAGTARLWWGQCVDSPQTLKLVVDWKSPEEHMAFYSSTEFAALNDSYKADSKSIDVSESRQYGLGPTWQSNRQCAFATPRSHYASSISVFITYYLSAELDLEATYLNDSMTPKRSKAQVWSKTRSLFDIYVAMRNFSKMMVGGWSLTNATSTGFSSGNTSDGSRSYIMVFRYKNIEAARHFLYGNVDDVIEWKWCRRLLETFDDIADRGRVVELVQMKTEYAGKF